MIKRMAAVDEKQTGDDRLADWGYPTFLLMRKTQN
jgi:hypothetical protein